MRLFVLLNHIDNAKQSLQSNRTRSYLTMLGVTIGIASVTTILALSAGASKVISDQVDELGGNIAVIRPGLSPADPITSLTSVRSTKGFATSTLSEYDLKLIRASKHVSKAAPLMILSGTIKADSTAPPHSTIVATTPELAGITKLDISDGQFLSENINQDTAVIGAQLSIDVFGTKNSIGKRVSVRGQDFTVVGILKRLGDPINYNSIDFDNAVIINLESGKQLSNHTPQIQQINVKSDSISNLGQAIVNINKVLLFSHDGENDFTVLTGDKIAQPTSDLFYAIAGVTTAVAAISLLVGGVGVMNIMLVNVAERRREIGIRKALGASNSDVAWQFLIESLAIGIGGGISGYLFGYGLAFAISTFLTFDPLISWEIAAIAGTIALIIGTLFGIYPSIRAARKDPIESLRHYE